MRRIVASLALLALLAPAAAIAADQTGPPPSAAAPSGMDMQRMQQVRSEITRIHAQTRAAILASLTPAHKAEFAKAIGDMAIAVTPDPGSVAQRLDAMLTPQERSAVVAAHEAARAKTISVLSQSGGHPPMPAAQTPDAGHILLMMAVPMPMMMQGHSAMAPMPHPE